MNVDSGLNAIKNILFVFLFVLVMFLLKELASILIPLVLAVLIALMFQPFVAFLQKLRFPKWIIFPIVTIITLMILFGVYAIISQTIDSIIQNQDFLIERLNTRIKNIVVWLNTEFNANFQTDSEYLNIGNLIKDFDMSGIISGFANTLGSFTGSFVMFTLYYVILLIGMADYDKYLAYVRGNMESNFMDNIKKIQNSIFSYLMIKTLISLFTAVLVYVTCLLFEINFAFFWAFLTFLLNYIPSIGSIAATFPPVLMSFIQNDSIQPVLFLLLILAAIQITMGNLVEPIIMGNKLKLNTLTVIFGLVFWGYIWGIPGMIVSIPLLVLIKLIFEHFPDTHIFARIMGSPE